MRQLYLDTLKDWPHDEVPKLGAVRADRRAPAKKAPAKAAAEGRCQEGGAEEDSREEGAAGQEGDRKKAAKKGRP